jgi:hypothetical protein
MLIAFCAALGLDYTWYAVINRVKKDERAYTP